ncbi:MAG TPA: hypothetical protein VGK48_20240 [Terriglobia bacterium]|jgi:hypothetical protein
MENVRNAVQDAFTLGWQIVELQSRLKVEVPNANGPDRWLRLPSMWRSCFSRVAAITNQAFPEATTTNTVYAPPKPGELKHLYPASAGTEAPAPISVTGGAGGTGTTAVPAIPAPQAAVDYADIGITRRTDATDKNKTILNDFALYDVTRRSINCVTLLYTEAKESLTPAVINDLQSLLLQAVPPNLTTDLAGTDLQKARTLLTSQSIQYLEAWHGYLREHYYAGGQLPNNGLELIAYEAGHSMCSLSWELLVAIVPLENSPGSAPSEITKAWDGVFTDQAIMRLQHQVSALSSALDDAYYLEHPEQKKPTDTDSPSTPNPDLPSQSIRAIKDSLDYWLAAVKWISQPENQKNLRNIETDKPGWRRLMRLALTEQTNVWQTLLTGQESLRGYNMETAAHKIMEEITTDIGNGVRNNFIAEARQAQTLVKDIRSEAAAAVENAFGASRALAWALVICGIVVAVGGGLLLFPSISHLAAGTGGAAAIVTSVWGILNLSRLKNSSDQAINQLDQKAGGGTSAANSGLLSGIEGVEHSAEVALMQAFQRGYEQMRIELDSLNRSVAVSYPLVEFFGRTLKLDSDIDFLKDIFWNGTKRAEEIERIIRAAFGALSLMADPGSTAEN